MKDPNRKKRALIIVGSSAVIGATVSAPAILSMVPGLPLFFVVFCYLGALALIALGLYEGHRRF